MVVRRLRTSRRRGFTLIEMLVVMTLLVAFGYLVFSLMRGSLELWRKGEAGRDLGEKSAAVFDLALRDLRALHTGRGGRLLSEIALEGVGAQAYPSRRLRLIRTVNRSEELQALQTLGLLESSPGEPSPEIPVGGGLLEVAYATTREAGNDAAMQMLYRGMRPIGAVSKSFFEDGFFSNSGAYGESLKVVTGGVLYFGLAFGSANVPEEENADESTPAIRGGPQHCWDSTRGVLGRESDLIANRFSWGKGADSFSDPRDDVYPRFVLLTLVLERDSSESRLTFLRKPIDEEERRIEVDDPKRLPTTFPNYIKIDAEWIEIGSVEGKTAVAKRRGARSTLQAAHAEAAKIHVGQTFRTMLELGKYREDLNATR